MPQSLLLILTIYRFCSSICLCEDIFRDYAFVEKYPQRWIFPTKSFRFDIEDEVSENGEQKVTFNSGEALDATAVAFLRNHIYRIQKLKKMEETRNSEIPKSELDAIWEYTDALVNAMRLAIQASFEENPDLSDKVDALCAEKEVGLGTTLMKACLPPDGYDVLDDEADLIWYEDNKKHYGKPMTCDNAEIMEFDDWQEGDMTKSAYQQLNFVTKPEDDNVCFDLDDVVQICANYRPHYHEYNMDYAARYLDEVKRVVFVGGGDSMLLHETLKYPELELVVGLELDQQVVRKSFKFFHSSPHFDDERVEWWFGDATKSLLMLPREYFASFDLVLIDLSETVMALSVTDELDIFEALSLLLRPGGIMVKNENYLEQMSHLFDYTAFVYKSDVPVICDQLVIMGSNEIDFITATPKDHDVGTKILEPITIHPRDLFHDYRKTSAQHQGKCNKTIEEGDDRFTRQAGIVMIAEVEKANVANLSLSGIKAAFTEFLERQDLNPIKTIAPNSDSDGGATVVIVMQEGNVVARVWREYQYVALDVHLWGAFHKLETVTDGLVEALGSSKATLSSYKIVVGGMRGSKTWTEDVKAIGPRLRQTRNCDPDQYGEKSVTDQATLDTVLEKSLDLIQEPKVAAVVLCGDDKNTCKSLNAVSKHSSIDDVHIISTCAETAECSATVDDNSQLIDCENETLEALSKAISKTGEKIGAFVVDPSVPNGMLKILTSVWNSRRARESFLSEELVFVALIPDHDNSKRPKHNFMDRLRKVLEFDPVHSAELVLTNSDTSMEVAILSKGDLWFFRNFDKMRKEIEENTSLNVEVRKVQGGMIGFQERFEPFEFKTGDYGDLPARLEQFASQTSLGRHIIFQLHMEDDGALISSSHIRDALQSTIESLEFEIIEMESFSGEFGEGSLAVATLTEGNVNVIWGGENHVDVSLFTHDESVALANKFLKSFIDAFPIPINMSLRDDMPRGFNRVINFKTDLSYVRDASQTSSGKDRCKDKDANCKEWAEDGQCLTNAKYMLSHCNESCGYPSICTS